ncbi:MAG: glycosyltransferase family 39 protein [Anaerolineales bacterium]|nr:glycosyltransferase family 39 protein [Anaerolineales bacterium]
MKIIRKLEVPILFFVALATYYMQSIAWPFTLGRDGGNYITYYLDILSKEPVFKIMMLLRTPIAPLLYGLLLSLGGVVLTELVMGLLYSGAIIGIYHITKMWSIKLAFISALIVNFYPSYGAIYHTISSEAPLSLLFILWCLFFLKIVHNPGVKEFIGLGAMVFLLILTRPTLIAYVLYAVAPYILFNSSFKEKSIYALSFLGILIPLVLLWCTYNFVRYDDFTIARTNNAQIPLYRVFLITHTVNPENGKASAQLTNDVEKFILSKEPYRSYGITKEIFFSKGTSRMFGDLIGLSDEIYGWDSDYRILKRVGLEAIYKCPKEYLLSVFKSFAGILLKSYSQSQSIRVINTKQETLYHNGLPVPTEGDFIPRSYYYGNSFSPTGKFKTDPNSVELKFLDPVTQEKVDKFNSRIAFFESILPSRDGDEIMALIFNTISKCFLPPLLWLLFGVMGLVLNFNMKNKALAFICLINFVILFYTILGLPSIPAMRVPFEPLLIIFAIIGIEEIVLKVSSSEKIRKISRFS